MAQFPRWVQQGRLVPPFSSPDSTAYPQTSPSLSGQGQDTTHFPTLPQPGELLCISVEATDLFSSPCWAEQRRRQGSSGSSDGLSQ